MNNEVKEIEDSIANSFPFTLVGDVLTDLDVGCAVGRAIAHVIRYSMKEVVWCRKGGWVTGCVFCVALVTPLYLIGE